jgi:hypothetical protein
MMAVYTSVRASYAFFLAFILLGTFFLMNLFTAVVYTKYQECEAAYEDEALAMTELHLTKAFRLLDVDSSGNLSREEMFVVMKELRKAHLLPDLIQVTNIPPASQFTCRSTLKAILADICWLHPKAKLFAQTPESSVTCASI